MCRESRELRRQLSNVAAIEMDHVRLLFENARKRITVAAHVSEPESPE
jgi:hypothetical protein